MSTSPSAPAPLVGVILAGGLSRRMFAAAVGDVTAPAGDKGLLPLGATTMLGQVIARFKPQVSAIVLNVNGDPTRFADFGLPTVADPIAGFAGPLAGILAGMRWAATHWSSATHIVTVSADAPFLPADLAVRLWERASAVPGGIALAQSGGTEHPVIGCWPVALADDLERALHDGVRKVLRWTDRHGTLLVDFAYLDRDGTRIDPFFNANTPDELQMARSLIDRFAKPAP